jgi:hypothetical protein
MNDGELKTQLETLQANIEALAITVADQQVLIWELIAQQMAFGTILTEVLAKEGQSKTMLRLRLHSAYRKAKEVVKAHQKSVSESGEAALPFDIPPILPDETDN